MIQYIYNKVFAVLAKKPIRLWGLSLLSGLLVSLAWLFGCLPIISMPIAWVLTLGMEAVFLAGYRGGKVDSDDLFSGFKKFIRNAAGMGWKELWLFIWALVPVAGLVLVVIKGYSYRFVPFILADDEKITATQALKKSMAMTEGYKGKMFGAEVLLYAVILVASLVLSLLSRIPYLGFLFVLILFIFHLLVSALSPLAFGLLRAAFYDELVNGADPQKYSAYAAQREAERQMKEQMKAQMEAYRQQQMQQMQAQMAAQQAAAQAAAAQQAQMAAQQAAAQAAAAQQAQMAAQQAAAQQAAAQQAAQAAAEAADQTQPTDEN